MMEIFDLETWRSMLFASTTDFLTRIRDFLPSVILAVLIMMGGWVVARLLRWFTVRFLHRLGLDRTAERLQLTGPLSRAGLDEPPSAIVGRFLYWTLFLVFLLSAVQTLGLAAFTGAIDRLIGYLPSIVAATLIVLIGLLVGRLARGLVSSGAAAANLAHAARVGAVADAAIVLLAAVLALEQLGIATELLVTMIAVVLGTACLAAGATFALGARRIVAHILAGHFLRQNLGSGRSVEIRGRRGEIERIGSIDTVLRSPDQTWSVPNAVLIEEIVEH